MNPEVSPFVSTKQVATIRNIQNTSNRERPRADDELVDRRRCILIAEEIMGSEENNQFGTTAAARRREREKITSDACISL